MTLTPKFDVGSVHAGARIPFGTSDLEHTDVNRYPLRHWYSDKKCPGMSVKMQENEMQEKVLRGVFVSAILSTA